MPHNWKYHEKAKKATERLILSKLVKETDKDMVRGIIQIAFEEA